MLNLEALAHDIAIFTSYKYRERDKRWGTSKTSVIEDEKYKKILMGATDQDNGTETKIFIELTVGCGSVGRAVVSNSRGLQFESSHRKINIEMY